MATQLTAPKIGQYGVQATHYKHVFRHNPLVREVESFVVYGAVDHEAGTFQQMNPIVPTDGVVIQGEDYDALLSAGSAPGRFWPEDVLASHVAIAQRAAREVLG